ncbi:RES domain-containing protein [Microbacterium protaetiae]|uniref:RES domain-containing protein n=1 Tax=Microbacterium protaetiae TaxID=2509458 RepID=A0A4P6EE31_9MICO|nr:RES family NAD+ phosphorylase [Microbacterium protaetiae]QAY60542.1 RES domain-containing protein [Microbacterium protaetiae]
MTGAEIPGPPTPFDALTHVLPGGSILHRVHNQRRAGNMFNPGIGAPTRFAPFTTATGPVPTLYAAATPEVAVSESILHGVPLSGGILPYASYAALVETTLELQRPVRLAKLMGDGLRRLGITPQQLTATSGDVYDRTVLWARAAHEAGFDGLAWMSARDNTAEAYVLFGDRISAEDLAVTGAGIGPFASGTAGFPWLSAYCSRVRVELLIA